MSNASSSPGSSTPHGVPNRTRRVIRSTAYSVAFLFALSLLPQPVAAANPAANLDQCANGKLSAPQPCEWVNGNLGESKSHYYEGQSIPYRAIVSNLAPGSSHNLDIGWDIKHSGKHAIDYLTHYQRIPETADPCLGVSPCSFGGTFPVPLPAGSPQPQTSFNALPAAERMLSIYGGTINGASYLTQGSLTASQSESTLRITFTAGASGKVVLAWGGHIGSSADWGDGNAAGGISGSPYHMRIKALDGSGGNQDRSLGAAAVVPVEPQGASLTVVKDVINDDGGSADAADFSIHVLDALGDDIDGSPAAGDPFGRSYVDLPAGDYSLAEDAAPGYSLSFSGDCAADGSISLADGDIKTCVLTNDDDPSFLTVIKQFVNDDGGDATLDDVILYIDGQPVGSGNATQVLPGSHVVSEAGPAGYAAFFAGDCDDNGTVEVPQGESRVCLITDDDIAPILTVTKVVINDDGGDATVASFPLFVDDALVLSGVPSALAAGDYTVSETGSAGYAATISGDCASDGSVSLAPGDEKSCTITNDDIAPRLTLTKLVVTDDGGDAEVADFPLFVDGQPVQSGAEHEYLAGSHQASETGQSGYAAAFSGDCDANGTVLLAPGDVKSCTITNDDIRPRLTVTKLVVNDDGGLAVAADATLFVDDHQVASGVEESYDVGDYLVSELGPAGYAASFGGDCAEDGSVSLAPGDAKACTITNDDIQPRLTVTKIVINDDNGSAQVSDFALWVDDSSVLSGQEQGFDAGDHTVSETGLSGYAATISGDCAADGSIHLAPGDVKSCTITNDDIRPRLTVTKIVVTDDGGSAVVADFPLFVDGQSVASGAEGGFDAGLHVVSEQGLAGYAASFSGDCDDAGQVVLAPGDVKSCTITNDDIRPLLTVVKVVVNDNGGQATIEDAALFVGDLQVASGQQNGFDVGDYLVSEQSPFGYNGTLSGDCAADGSIRLDPGDVKVCVFTNDDIQPLLTITKVVVNDNGGQALVSDFALYVGDQLVLSGEQAGFDAGDYHVSESGPAGYAASVSGDCDAGYNVSLSVGEAKACTITNDDIQPRLTVTKVVINDDGGEASVESFSLDVSGTAVLSGLEMGFDAGDYLVGESGPSGYAASFSGDCAADGSIHLDIGDVKSCTITNDDIAPRLTLTKLVINDDGGSAQVADFPLFVDGQSVQSGAEHEYLAGSHQASETGLFGYAASFSGDCDANGSVSLSVGDVKSCTLTNDDIRPLLTVTKIVINDNGGDAEVADFALWAGDEPVESGVQEGFGAGDYLVSESGPSGYAASFSGDCDGNGSVSLSVGDVKSCTLTNDDIQPRLTVTKVVITDDGGSAQVADFPLFVDGQSVLSGEEHGFDAGDHLVGETGLFGYAASFSGDCDADGNVSLSVGDVKSCTITNDDIAPRLTVTKIVVNDDGGDLEVADFPLWVDGQSVASGAQHAYLAGSHQVSENGSAGYAASFSGDCDSNGTVALAPGDVKSCTITNDDIAPQLTVLKLVTNDDGGSAEASDFALDVSGTAFTSGAAQALDAGDYHVSESGPAGYAGSFSGDCDADGNVSLALAEQKLCILTNDDIAPKLRVVKVLILDSGGAAEVGDFAIHVAASDASPSDFQAEAAPGTLVTLDAGAYAVSEELRPEFQTTYSAGCSGNLSLGEERTCTITNDDIALSTRTQGFWSTHTDFTKKVFSAKLGGSMTVGTGSHTRVINDQGKLFGAWYSDIAKMTVGGKRTDLDQARMVLLQQLVTAKLNCAAFGCSPGSWALISQGDSAYAGSSAAAMKAAASALDVYNNSGDSHPIPSALGAIGKATPQVSKQLANKPFWNSP